jgi:hypothetical protein
MDMALSFIEGFCFGVVDPKLQPSDNSINNFTVNNIPEIKTNTRKKRFIYV